LFRIAQQHKARMPLAIAVLGGALVFGAAILPVQNSNSASANRGEPGSSFPDATTTGVPEGMALKPTGSITADTPDSVISGVDVRGEVVINAPNVTLKNCRVTSETFVAIAVFAPGARIEDCEILSAYTKGGTKGIYFDPPGTNGSVLRCNIHSVEDGVYIGSRNIVIEDNYIHDLDAMGGDPHYDGIQLHGGETSDVVIRNNSVVTEWSDNSAITTGVVQNVLIENNLLHGGGFTVRVDGRFGEGKVSGVSIVRNRFGPHEVDHWSFDLATPTVIGNVDDRTGEPIPGQSGALPVAPRQ
jgi:hypothetical protein